MNDHSNPDDSTSTDAPESALEPQPDPGQRLVIRVVNHSRSPAVRSGIRAGLVPGGKIDIRVASP